MLIDSPLVNLFLKIWVLLQKRFHQMVGLLCGAAHGKWASCMPWMRKCAAKLASYVALGRRLTQHTSTAAPPENNTPIKHTSGCHQHQDNGNSGLTWLASHTGIISMLKMSAKYEITPGPSKYEITPGPSKKGPLPNNKVREWTPIYGCRPQGPLTGSTTFSNFDGPDSQKKNLWSFKPRTSSFCMSWGFVL